MNNVDKTISAVLFSRNDNYSDDLKDRAIICLKYLIDSVDEIIYVDWGTEKNKKPLLDELPDVISKNPKVKQIVVSEEEVKKIIPHNADKMCQVFPRNIGIRNATKNFILSTNLDIIVPSREEIKKIIVSENDMYVISRKNVDMNASCILFNANPDIVKTILSWHVKERNQQIDTNPIRFFEKDALNQLSSDSELYKNYIKYAKIYNCGDFQLASKKLWFDIKGFEEDMILHWGNDTNVQVKVVNHGFNLKILTKPDVFHLNHGERSSHIAGKIKMNDMDYFMNKFKLTENKNDWGLIKKNLKHF